MNCIFLSRGKPTPMTKTVALAGTFSSSYGYVTINGTKYTSAQTIEVESGTEISVYVASSNNNVATNAYVTHNGTTVQSGKGTYTFVLESDTSIELTKVTTGYIYTYYTATITTA